ncbi:MAG: Hpt domain-containing protein [Bdellovibrionales bacterium]|nr:Hpt domain-containing protein [Bdellovibrionales bacterium]
MNDQPIFDKAGALERVEDDTELFFELIEMFFEDYDEQVTSIQSAISSSAAKELEETAHSIKSALGNIGAMKAYSLAYELEKLGREGSPNEGADLLGQLKESISLFQEEVESFRSSL